MSILSGHKKYERYLKTNNGYQLCSMKTYADSVHFSDGTTVQNNLGGIKGITDSLTATSSNVALSAAAGNNLQTQVSELNSNLALFTGELVTNYSDKPISYACNIVMAMICIDGLKNVTKGTYVTICTLPEKARPRGNRVIDVRDPLNAHVRVIIQDSGAVLVHNYTDNSIANIVTTFTYML